MFIHLPFVFKRSCVEINRTAMKNYRLEVKYILNVEINTNSDIILRVAKAESPPFRPSANLNSEGDIDPAMIQLMMDCWKEDPELRPTFKSVSCSIVTLSSFIS
jgi:hypothetical protein